VAQPAQTNSSETSTNTGQEVEQFLKLVASLEACNMALLNKLNQAERELAMLAGAPKASLPETKHGGHGGQAYGWERKLTRTQWRPK